MEVVTSPLDTIPDAAHSADARTSNAAAGCATAHIPDAILPAHSGRGRSWGHAYRQERYEGVVEELLGRVGANAGTLTAVVRKVGDRPQVA
jgi:hypothetical protein